MHSKPQSLVGSTSTGHSAAQSHDGVRSLVGTPAVHPLFLCVCEDGELDDAPSFTSQIDPDISLYALPSASCGISPLRTYEGMAARVVRIIRTVQPLGPYRLAGWRCGGILAYEIAFQLIGADQAVEFLGLIDAEYPSESSFSAVVDPQQTEDAGVASEPESAGHEWPGSTLAFDRSDAAPGRSAEVSDACPALTLAYSVPPLPTAVYLFLSRGHAQQRTASVDSWIRVSSANPIRISYVAAMQAPFSQNSGCEVLGKAISNAIRTGARSPLQVSAQQDHSPIIPLQSTSRGEQLFCIPGAGAAVTSFNDFVTDLGASRPFYGLQPRGLDGDQIPHSTVESCTEYYLRAMSSGITSRPIHLLGHSFGGWIALELAHRLKAKGCNVASLTIIDSSPPLESEVIPHEYSYFEVILEWVRAAEAYYGRSLGIEPLNLGFRPYHVQRQILHSRLVSINALPAGSSPDMLIGPLVTFGIGLRSQYSPKDVYCQSARLILARTKLSGLDYSQNELAGALYKWRRWAPKINPVMVSGNHISMLKFPHVREIASFFKERPGPEN